MIKDINDIIKLIDKINESHLSSFSLKFGDTKIKVDKQPIYTSFEGVNIPSPTLTVTDLEKKESTPSLDDDCESIKSPIVGIFHSLESCGKGSLNVGDKVKKGDTVCIVEAMKLMNEVESPCDGEVIEICVNEGEQVEYGQVLIKLKN